MNIFDKAAMEDKYSKMYAQLCQFLTNEELNAQGVKQSQGNLKVSQFRTALLKECQGAFWDLFHIKSEEEKKADEGKSAD